MEEIWKDHPRLVDVQVSSAGRIRKRINKRHPERNKDWHYFQYETVSDSTGYSYYRVSILRKKYVASRLVAETFIRELCDGEVVRHIDNDSRNNAVRNLRIGSVLDNVLDKLSHGTWQGGDKHPRTKYSDEIVSTVQAELASDTKRGNKKRIADKYGIPYLFVYDISRGRRKTFGQRVSDALCELSRQTPEPLGL